MRKPDCAATCVRFLEEKDPTWRVLAVAGESGAGKTTLANNIAERVGAAVLHQDDFFFLSPSETRAKRLEDLANVGKEEVNLAVLEDAIVAFREGAAAVTPPLHHHPVSIAGERLVIEGTYVLGLQGVDVRIFIDRTFQQTEEDRRRRGRDAMEPFIEEVLAIEQPIVRAQLESADIVVSADFEPRKA
jgi:uridine kinase